MEDRLYASHRVTPTLAWATAISCLSTIQFGFHLAVFNAPQLIISCKKHIPGPLPTYDDTLWSSLDLVQCIPMSLSGIAYINTMFTVGGLILSTIIGSHVITSFFGRRNLQAYSAILYLAGSACIVFANSLFVIDIGRFLAGLAAGASMVVAPILISELTPFNHRGLMGSMLQFGVAFGILMAQLVAFPWNNDQQWRLLFVFGAGLSLLQFVLLFTTVELPKWLILHKGDVSSATEILHTLRSDHSATRHEIHHWRRLCNNTVQKEALESTALLEECSDDRSDRSEGSEEGFVPLSTAMSRRGSIDPSTVSPSEYLTSPKYRKEWIAIAVIMTAQQLCGMNAITFYGVSVLSNIVPDGTNVLYLTSALAFTNGVCSLAVSPFIDLWGRKPLLLLSVTTMALCSVCISMGLLRQLDYLAAGGCFGFIFGFSVGLGQIPFLMVSELSSHEVVGMAQSIGTMFNWVANVAVAYLFPMLREVFGDSTFFMFFFVGFAYFAVIYITVPETKGKMEYDDVWEGYD